jgi:hypothetical protein
MLRWRQPIQQPGREDDEMLRFPASIIAIPAAWAVCLALALPVCSATENEPVARTAADDARMRAVRTFAERYPDEVAGAVGALRDTIQDAAGQFLDAGPHRQR